MRSEASDFRISELLKETVRDAPTLLGYTPRYKTFLESRRLRDQRRAAGPSTVREAVLVEEPYVVGPTASEESEQARQERKERKRALKRRLQTLAGGVQMLHAVDIEAGTYAPTEVKEEPWTGPDLLEQTTLPITGDGAPRFLEAGEPSIVREPLAPTGETAPKTTAPEVTVPG